MNSHPRGKNREDNEHKISQFAFPVFHNPILRQHHGSAQHYCRTNEVLSVSRRFPGIYREDLRRTSDAFEGIRTERPGEWFAHSEVALRGCAG